MADPNDAPDDGRDLYVDGKPPAAVPYDRFVRAVGMKNEERARATEAATALQAREAELTAERARAAELETKHAELSERFGLHRVGLVDDEAVVVARALYAATPEADRPRSLVDWISTVKGKPDAVPRALAPYLGGLAQAPAAPAAPAQAAAPVVPPTQADPATPQPTGPRSLPPPQHQGAPPSAAVTAEQLRAAREAAVKSGDWAAFNALSAKVRVGRPG